MSEQADNFFTKLERRIQSVDSHLCVGLDPHPSEIGVQDSWSEEDACGAAFTFCKTIIDKTAPFAAAYKPNGAFFESLGVGGLETLRRVIEAIPDDIPVLLDVKRGDIGSTAVAYATSAYDHMKADGVTLSPLMGWDSVSPFVTGKYQDRGAFMLCKTSNPGSNEILALDLASGQKVYEEIAKLAKTWSPEGGLGLVVGATDPIALAKVRAAAGPDVWILAPGVGAQGGNLNEACRAGMNAKGTGMLVPVSRELSRSADLSAKAQELRDAINAARIPPVTSDDEQNNETTNIEPYQKAFLEFSLAEGVLKFGSFVLKSGRTSPYFFNAGLFSKGGALYKLGSAYASAIMASKELTNEDGTVNFDVVFGPAYKGISLGALVCAALYSGFGVDVGFAYNRKEQKTHGEGGMLVGSDMKEKRVLVVDDVITAGTAIRESHTMLTEIGAKPVGVVIALDRAEKRSLDDPVSAVQAVARDLALPVVSIVSLQQLQLYLQKSPELYGEETLAAVSAYRAEYGV
jgi:orotidine 5'-phosphate decarboxylase subfamily 2